MFEGGSKMIDFMAEIDMNVLQRYLDSLNISPAAPLIY